MDIVSTLMLLLGLAMIPYGANGLVKHTKTLGEQLNVSQVLIGTLVLGFGSSLPELAVSLDAALLGHPDVAIGNIVGSNIANLALVIPLTVIIYPILINQKAVKTECVIMLCVTLLFVLVTGFFGLTRVPGVIFILTLSGYLYYQRNQHPKSAASTKSESNVLPILINLAKITLYLTMLVAGAHFFLKGILALGNAIGLSEATVGAIFAAVGTALPELTISIMAARHKHTDLIFGSIIGSNVFNLIAIGGITALVAPSQVNPSLMHFDYIVLTFITVLITALLFKKDGLISRKIGVGLLCVYCAYSGYLFS